MAIINREAVIGWRYNRRDSEICVTFRYTQFIIATHSPILMTFPETTILSLDGGHVHEVSLEETQHYQITRGILEAPERYWRHLKG